MQHLVHVSQFERFLYFLSLICSTKLDVVTEDAYEIEMNKSVVKYTLPLHIGFFFYQYSKLRMLHTHTHTCSFELKWFEESAPTSPPIHRWHL